MPISCPKSVSLSIYIYILLFLLTALSICSADTFTHRENGKSFNGYIVQKKQGGKVQVRSSGGAAKYINLSDYDVEANYLGRRNKVSVFTISNPIDLIYETDVFEKSIIADADRGPIFILIEIDSSGGKVDLARRFCEAIIATDNCTTVAFITGGKTGGAFSEAAIVALSCDKVFISEGASIGALPERLQVSIETKASKESTAASGDNSLNSAWAEYASAAAERKGRSGLLTKAMIDKNVEVVEIKKDSNSVFVTREDSKSAEKVQTWKEKGTLLTLSAQQAVQTGLAEKIVNSRDELLKYLEASKASEVQDTSFSKARRELQRVQRDMDVILSSITFLKGQAEGFASDAEVLKTEFRRYNSVTIYSRPRDLGTTRAILFDYNAAVDKAIGALNELMANCRRGLDITARYPDLSEHKDTLEATLKSADSMNRELNKPLF